MRVTVATKTETVPATPRSRNKATHIILGKDAATRKSAHTSTKLNIELDG